MQLFYDTVHEINICDYTQEQVDTWAPENMSYETWLEKLQTKLTYVVEENGQIVGFGQLESDGHIDCFYCHNKYQRKGIGSMLLNHIEKTAGALGIKQLFTEVSSLPIPTPRLRRSQPSSDLSSRLAWRQHQTARGHIELMSEFKT